MHLVGIEGRKIIINENKVINENAIIGEKLYDINNFNFYAFLSNSLGVR